MNGWELDYKSVDMPQKFRMPRRFPNFEEAWETARKIIEVYRMDELGDIELTFRRVE